MAHVHAIDPDRPFLATLVEGLLAWDREALADTLLLLPSRRACLAAREAFARLAGGEALLLPRMVPVGEPDEAQLVLDGAIEAELPPAVGPLRRRLLLARLVLARSSGMTHEQAVRLAGELERFLDELHDEEVDLGRLDDLVPADLAEHWQESLAFLGLLRDHWPAILAEAGLVDGARRRRLLLDATAGLWRRRPPRGPVVAAGVTGTIPAVARLLAVVAGLPRGAVVLQALDRAGLEDEAWAQVDAGHPQHALKRLLEAMGVDRAAVAPWPEGAPAAALTPTPRQRLWSEVFRPAPTTGAWRRPAADLAAGLAEVELDVAPDPAGEALRVALRLRRALETPGKRAALVTPSRALGRRVAAELLRWGVRVDDSAGVPLDQSPPGGFLLLTAQLAAPGASPVLLLAALKHPLAAGGLGRGEFRRRARLLERLALRGVRPAEGLPGLADALRERDGAGDGEGLRDWVAGVAEAAQPLAELMAGKEAPLADLLGAHLAFAEWLAADADGDPAELWAREAGRKAREVVDELARSADAAGPVPTAGYPAVLAMLMGAATVRPDAPAHPRLAILGQLEARLAEADLVVLGGLNEGTWPPPVEAGPWLNRAMRQRLGLPPAEQAVGIAAHDLLAVAGAAPELVLSRALKDDAGAPTVASRWVARLLAALAAAGQEGAVAADPAVAAWARGLDEPAGAPRPAPRPSPRPPLAARPRELWAADVERLMRDPYAVYASRILGLAPLDQVDADAGGAARGQIIHAVLAEFVRLWADRLPDDPRAELLRLGRARFERLGAARPQVLAVWWPRFERVAAWFAEAERRRREEVARVAARVQGALELAAPGGAFRVRARAHRVEVGRDGRLGIVGYRTGPLPDGREVRGGLAPQLAIEALIAEAGGFEAVPAGEAAGLRFVQLKGGEALPGAERDPLGREGDLRLVLREAEAGLARLLAHFDDPTTAYPPVPSPEIAPGHSDYEHLARVGEWLGTEADP